MCVCVYVSVCVCVCGVCVCVPQWLDYEGGCRDNLVGQTCTVRNQVGGLGVVPAEVKVRNLIRGAKGKVERDFPRVHEEGASGVQDGLQQFGPHGLLRSICHRDDCALLCGVRCASSDSSSDSEHAGLAASK